MPSEIIPLMVVLLIVFSALGYLWFLGRFPVLGKCDTIKRTYMLHVFAPLALLGADSSANSLTACFLAWALLIMHNLLPVITHFPMATRLRVRLMTEGRLP
jgi:hypothetical protein